MLGGRKPLKEAELGHAGVHSCMCGACTHVGVHTCACVCVCRERDVGGAIPQPGGWCLPAHWPPIHHDVSTQSQLFHTPLPSESGLKTSQTHSSHHSITGQTEVSGAAEAACAWPLVTRGPEVALEPACASAGHSEDRQDVGWGLKPSCLPRGDMTKAQTKGFGHVCQARLSHF